jgi:hypothetical protein
MTMRMLFYEDAELEKPIEIPGLPTLPIVPTPGMLLKSSQDSLQGWQVLFVVYEWDTATARIHVRLHAPNALMIPPVQA